MTLYKYLKKQKTNQRKLWAVLLDPDKINKDAILPLIDRINHANPDLILVGGSFMTQNTMPDLVKTLKKKTDKPVVIFPGSPSQIANQADALLFLSLISGRNPEYLIGKHVEAAPFLFQSDLEVIPTGYILIENGHTTTVEYISNTKPIPRKKTELVLATAMAGELLGLKMLYLEAGSGAKKPVPSKMIQAISSKVSLPLIVGGGIKNKKQMLKAWAAGADLVVVGTAFENNSF
jgi:putative glycerol-1-phosphate prenyltransferase